MNESNPRLSPMVGAGGYDFKIVRRAKMHKYESMKKPFLRSKKPQKKQKRLEKDISISWGGRGRKFKSCHSDHIECS